ncbi:MAG TPA: hypothetical protein VFJ49_02910 [Methyloceanibacter sp.]|nr:hypothetical protein [Methyloceanibacter sp.]
MGRAPTCRREGARRRREPAHIGRVNVRPNQNYGVDKDAERTFMAGLKEGIAFLEEKTGFWLRASPQTVAGLGPLRRGTRFAWDCQRRFLEGYAETVANCRGECQLDAPAQPSTESPQVYVELIIKACPSDQPDKQVGRPNAVRGYYTEPINQGKSYENERSPRLSANLPSPPCTASMCRCRPK